MEERIINDKMQELAKLINYETDDISCLKKAMYCKQLDAKKQNYANSSLSTLGDAILKFVLTEYLFDKNLDQSQITNKKQEIENNKTLFELCKKYYIYKYAYNDSYFFTEAPSENQLPHSNHDIYIEAIIAAIYKDKGLEYCRNWVIEFFKKNNCLPN